MKRKRSKKGWWEQLQSGEYPKTKTNYGDIRAINRRSDETEYPVKEDSLVNIGKKLRCKSCGYERIITLDWLESIGAKCSLGNFEALRSVFAQYLPRLKCSKCGSKNHEMISLESATTDKTDKGKELAEESNHTDRPREVWNKKTCPACGGDGGPGGRCYRCYGTGWVE